MGFLAVALFRLPDEARAKEALGEAFARSDRLHSEFGGAPYMYLAGIAQDLAFANRPAEADAAYRRAAEAVRAAARGAPGQAEPRRQLALILSNWVQLAPMMQREERLRLAREAVAAAEEAVTLADAAPGYPRALANALWQLGQVADAEEGEAVLRRAVAVWREVAAGEPGAPALRENLAACRAGAIPKLTMSTSESYSSPNLLTEWVSRAMRPSTASKAAAIMIAHEA